MPLLLLLLLLLMRCLQDAGDCTVALAIVGYQKPAAWSLPNGSMALQSWRLSL
jgi:hypothetical protein